MEMKLVVDGAIAPASDLMLLRLIGKAQRQGDRLLRGSRQTISTLAQRKELAGSCVTRLPRLTFLAPSIVAAIMEGRQPIGLSAAEMMQLRTLQLEWHARTAPGAGHSPECTHPGYPAGS